MPGIGGFINSSRIFNWKSKTIQLRKAMCWGNNYKILESENQQKGIYLLTTASPSVKISKLEKEKCYRSVMFGELYPLVSNNNFALLQFNHKKLIDGYFKKGIEFFNTVDGAFLLAIWDEKENELIIANDIFGVFPLNYTTKGNFIFSSQSAAVTDILGIKDLDERAFAEHLGLNFILNGKTLFRDVRRMQPGSVLRIQNNNHLEIKYYKPKYTEESLDTLHQRIDQISFEFTEAIKKRISTDERIAVALSGGFDSRVIWSVFLGNKFNATAITFGEKSSADLKIAKTICSNLNIPHEIFSLNNQSMGNFIEFSKELVKMTEGFASVESAIVIPYYHWLQRKFDVIFDGTGSALYRRQVFRKNIFTHKKNKNLVSFFIRMYLNKHFTNGTINEQFANNSKEIIFENLKDYFDQYQGISAPEDLIDYFYLDQFIGMRFSADSLLQTHYINLRHPFCDRRTYDLVRHFAVKERKRLLIHKHIINVNAKKLKKTALVNSGIIVPYKGFLWKRVFPIGLNYLLKNIKFKLPKQFYNYYPIYNYNLAFRTYLKKELQDILLDPKTLNRPYWNRKKLENIVNNHILGKGDFSSTILNILTAELILRTFFDNK